MKRKAKIQYGRRGFSEQEKPRRHYFRIQKKQRGVGKADNRRAGKQSTAGPVVCFPVRLVVSGIFSASVFFGNFGCAGQRVPLRRQRNPRIPGLRRLSPGDTDSVRLCPRVRFATTGIPIAAVCRGIVINPIEGACPGGNQSFRFRFHVRSAAKGSTATAADRSSTINCSSVLKPCNATNTTITARTSG